MEDKYEGGLGARLGVIIVCNKAHGKGFCGLYLGIHYSLSYSSSNLCHWFWLYV